MLALASEDELLAISGRELYWLPSGGLMESAIGMNGITDVLGPNTMRTSTSSRSPPSTSGPSA